MVRKLVLACTGLGVAAAVAIYLLTIPLLRRLPKPSRVSVDGITTIDDAVEACKRTELHGWDLVAYAQNLAARKFTYSRLNTWDTPSRAFERGMGYCEQQALALKHIYDQLGIEARPVFALRCTFLGTVVDGVLSPEGVSGHAWLRVRIGDEELDVCSGSVNNKPGVTHFETCRRCILGSRGCVRSRTWDHPLKILGESTRPETLLDTLAELCKRRGHFCVQPKVSDQLSDDRGSGEPFSAGADSNGDSNSSSQRQVAAIDGIALRLHSHSTWRLELCHA